MKKTILSSTAGAFLPKMSMQATSDWKCACVFWNRHKLHQIHTYVVAFSVTLAKILLTTQVAAIPLQSTLMCPKVRHDRTSQLEVNETKPIVMKWAAIETLYLGILISNQKKNTLSNLCEKHTFGEFRRIRFPVHVLIDAESCLVWHTNMKIKLMSHKSAPLLDGSVKSARMRVLCNKMQMSPKNTTHSNQNTADVPTQSLLLLSSHQTTLVRK